MECPFSKIGFFDQDKNLLFEGNLSASGEMHLSSLFEFDLKQLPSSIAVCQSDVSPYFVMFPAIESFISEEHFSRAVEGTIMGDSPPLDVSVHLIIHGAKKAWNRLEIIVRKI